jgi:nitrogen fixation NifU-like protein
MSDAIYNDAIKAAARDRSHAGRLPSPDASVTCDNPLCGDRVTLDLGLDGGRIGAVAHKTRGCMLTKAAAGLVASRAASTPPERLSELLRAVQDFLTAGAPPPWPELAMFEPVRAVRSRHECVMLPFQALDEAVREAAAGKRGQRR